MINNLNSVLLEGSLISDPVSESTKYSFTIESKRSFKIDGEIREETSFFNVVTWLESVRTNGVCRKERLKKGCIVRVVGKLKQDTEKGVYIVADHMELSQIK